MSSLARRLFLSTRPMFFPASVAPIVVGSVWGAGPVDGTILVLSLLGMMLVHAAANVLNDVGDELNQCDRLNHDRISPFTGGSRFIQDGLLSVRQMAVWGLVLLAAAAAMGLVLAGLKGWLVMQMAVVGGALALAYSLRPVWLASRGWGEVAVALGFGLPVAAAGWLQGGVFTPGLLWAAAANGLFSAGILIANQFPDVTADQAVGKRHWVVRLGKPRARWLYAAVQSAGVACAMLAAWTGSAPWWLVVTIVPALALIVRAAPLLSGDRDHMLQAIRLTLTLHLLGGLWLVAIRCSTPYVQG